MGKKEKVAVTIDRVVLETTEKMRKRSGESRSAIVNRALRLLIADADQKTKIARYVDGYCEHPEGDEVIQTAEALATAALKGLPWD